MSGTCPPPRLTTQAAAEQLMRSTLFRTEALDGVRVTLLGSVL
jgi:hypothetical protein